MIETETLIRWARDLCAFVNAPLQVSYRDPEFTDLTEDNHGRDPAERTASETATLHTIAKKALTELAKWKRSAPGGVPPELLREAKQWLNHQLVRGTPMNGGELSLSEEGYLQIVPRFGSLDAKFAATFSDLIDPREKKRRGRKLPIIKRCKQCPDFFVAMEGTRGQPRKYCDTHYEELKQTYYKITVSKEPRK